MPDNIEPKDEVSQDQKDQQALAAVEQTRKEYEAAAADVTAADVRRPKIRSEVQKKVNAAMGDFEAAYAKLRIAKTEKAKAMHAAEAAASEALARRAQADALAKEVATRDKRAKENEDRKRAQAKEVMQYMREAATS